MKPKRYTYNIQHACFRCRKVFKMTWHTAEQRRRAWLSRSLSGRTPAKPFQEPQHVCPACGGEVEMMGRRFRAPRRGDTRAWRNIELLVRADFHFFSYRPGGYPSGQRAIREFIALNRRKSEGEKLAEKCAKRRR